MGHIWVINIYKPLLYWGYFRGIANHILLLGWGRLGDKQPFYGDILGKRWVIMAAMVIWIPSI